MTNRATIDALLAELAEHHPGGQQAATARAKLREAIDEAIREERERCADIVLGFEYEDATVDTIAAALREPARAKRCG